MLCFATPSLTLRRLAWLCDAVRHLECSAAAVAEREPMLMLSATMPRHTRPSRTERGTGKRSHALHDHARMPAHDFRRRRTDALPGAA